MHGRSTNSVAHFMSPVPMPPKKWLIINRTAILLLRNDNIDVWARNPIINQLLVLGKVQSSIITFTVKRYGDNDSGEHYGDDQGAERDVKLFVPAHLALIVGHSAHPFVLLSSHSLIHNIIVVSRLFEVRLVSLVVLSLPTLPHWETFRRTGLLINWSRGNFNVILVVKDSPVTAHTIDLWVRPFRLNSLLWYDLIHSF